jgi:hypothetical protein
MLTLSKNIRFEAPCRIELHGLKAEFRCVFRLLPIDELDALQKSNPTARAFVDAVLVDWVFGDVQDDDGQPLTYSPENVDKLLNVPGAPVALVEGFYRGYEKATEGNSAAPSAGS